MSMYGAAGDYSQLMRAQEEDADDTQVRRWGGGYLACRCCSIYDEPAARG